MRYAAVTEVAPNMSNPQVVYDGCALGETVSRRL